MKYILCKCVSSTNNCNDIIKMQFRHTRHTVHIIGPMPPPMDGKVMPRSLETVV